MSKGNMLLGHARGKVGDLVFSRSNGEQVVRARAAIVKNPRTEKQMIQRILLATIGQAYSRMSAITDHSFEGVSKGQPSMSAFMGENLKALRAKVVEYSNDPTKTLAECRAFTPLGTNIFASNEYVIAKGTLPVVAVNVRNNSTQADVSAFESVAQQELSYQMVVDKLGLQRGDQLTFIAVHGATAQSATFHYARVILDPVNQDGSPADMSVSFLGSNLINLPNPRNEGTFAVIQQNESYGLFFALKPTTTMRMAAVIVSRRGANGVWQRSTTALALNQQAVAGELSMYEALSRVTGDELGVGSEIYLNNAGNTPGTISSNSGDITPDDNPDDIRP